MTELLEHHLPAPSSLSFKEQLFSTMVESKQSGPCQGMQSLSKAMEGACFQYLHHICLGTARDNELEGYSLYLMEAQALQSCYTFVRLNI